MNRALLSDEENRELAKMNVNTLFNRHYRSITKSGEEKKKECRQIIREMLYLGSHDIPFNKFGRSLPLDWFVKDADIPVGMVPSDSKVCASQDAVLVKTEPKTRNDNERNYHILREIVTDLNLGGTTDAIFVLFVESDSTYENVRLGLFKKDQLKAAV